MTRRRTRSQSGQLVCNFEGCGVALNSVAELKAHDSVHYADKPLLCTSLGCTARFATASKREEHMRVAHRKRRSKRKRLEDEESVLVVDEEPEKEKETLPDKNNDVGDEEAEEEADEVAENAAYLASQMKIARSYAIAKWVKQDYLNAHLWAVWVQNAVNDFSDIPVLARVLNGKNLSVAPLRSAERGFFDSVLGYEGFSAETLQHLISSVIPSTQEDADEEQEKESFNCLVAAIGAAIERKKELTTLDQILSDIDTMMPNGDATCGDFTTAAWSSERHDVLAKADMLLRRHNRLADSEVRRHLHTVKDKIDDEMFEILANEARLACDLANKKEIEGSTTRTSGQLLAFISSEFEKNSEEILRQMDSSLLIELCEHDFQLFDSYLSSLLRKHQALSSAPADRTIELVKGGVVSLKQAANERIRGGKAQELELEEVNSRICELTRRQGRVGYVSKSVVEAYFRKLGLQLPTL